MWLLLLYFESIERPVSVAHAPCQCTPARVAGDALAARAQYSVGSASELALHVEAAVRHAEIVEPVGHTRCICLEESEGCSTAAEAYALWLPVAAPERFLQETPFVEGPLSWAEGLPEGPARHAARRDRYRKSEGPP